MDTAAPAAVPDYHRAVVSDSSAPTAGRSAAAILAGAAAGSHLAGAAADAWFLAAIGPGRLGLAVAGSSFLVALVVAAVGGATDGIAIGAVVEAWQGGDSTDVGAP